MHGNADTRIVCSPSERKVELAADTKVQLPFGRRVEMVAYTESAAPLRKKEGNGCIHGECSSPSDRRRYMVAYTESAAPLRKERVIVAYMEM